LAKAGKIDEAIKTAHAIRDRGARGNALKDIATIQAEKGDWSAAHKMVEAIEDGIAKVNAVAVLGRLRAKAGMKSKADELFAEAVRIAGDFDDTKNSNGVGDRAFALCGIIHEQVESGNLKAAMKTAGTIPEFAGFPFRSLVLADLRAKAGDIDGALEAARTLPEGRHAAEGLKFVAEAQARAKDIGPALRTIESIRDDYTRAATLVAVGSEQARAGDRKGAAETFGKALREAAGLTEGKYRLDDQSRQFLLRALAAAQAEVGEDDATKAWIAKESSAYVKTFALVGLAEGANKRREAGDRPRGQ
jgi:tetratricopeptide (TPR) repeat protein